MALEKRNPVPPGVYWIDVWGDNRAKFLEWTALPTIQVRKTRSYEAIDDWPARDWLLFEVVTPTAWPNLKGIGFPTIAPKGLQTEAEDTAQRPDPPKPSDYLPSFSGFGKVLLVAAGAAGSVGAVWLIYKLAR